MIVCEHKAGQGVKILNKQFYEQFFIPDVENYIEFHENPEAIARANIFAGNFDLNHFKKITYANMPSNLREKSSQKYKELMQNPVFFLTFAPFTFASLSNGFTIPGYLEKNIRRKEINVPEEDISIRLFIPLNENKKRIANSKCIVIHNKLRNDQLQKYLKYIDCTYKGSFIRLVVRNLIQDHKNSFGKSDEYDYTNWPAKYIIQDSIDGNTLFHNFDNNLENYDEINRKILQVKNSYGRTPLFYQSSGTIRLFSKVYIDERDKNGFSALGWQLYKYRQLAEETWDNLIKNIKDLIKKGIRLDIQSFMLHNGEHVPYSNPIHEAVLLNNFDILEILSTGKGFDRAINQSMASKEFENRVPYMSTPLNYARKIASDKIIKIFLKSKGALKSSYTGVGMSPLHFYAQYPKKIEILQNVLKGPYYQSFTRIKARDRRGHTPLYYAILEKNTGAIDLLKKYFYEENLDVNNFDS